VLPDTWTGRGLKPGLGIDRNETPLWVREDRVRKKWRTETANEKRRI